MVKKKTTKKITKKKVSPEKKPVDSKVLELSKERDIAMDFATKTYNRFDKIIKSIVLFGSSAKKVSIGSSDIDLVILIDDVSVRWDQELISWYREELSKLVSDNIYRKKLHINTIKLSSWWDDLTRGDPVVLNIIRYGEPLIDIGGFFIPLKILLQEGKIKPTPEAVYTLLQRAPTHIYRMRTSLLAAVDGVYWACLDSAQAALIAHNVLPPSPEHIGIKLEDTFVSQKKLKRKYVDFYSRVHKIAKGIVHGTIKTIDGKQIDEFSEMANEFVMEMSRLVEETIK